jgi:hypothetical protein
MTDVLSLEASREFQDEEREARLRRIDLDKIVAAFAKSKNAPAYRRG